MLSDVYVHGVSDIAGSGGLYTTGAKIKSMVLDNVGFRGGLRFNCEKGGYVGSLIIRNCTCTNRNLTIETAEPIDVNLENCTFGHIWDQEAANIYHITNCDLDGKYITSFVGTAKQLEELLNAM